MLLKLQLIRSMHKCTQRVMWADQFFLSRSAHLKNAPIVMRGTPRGLLGAISRMMRHSLLESSYRATAASQMEARSILATSAQWT